MVNIMESGFVKRPDPMMWLITTAGYNPDGPNSEFLRRCKQMLDGALKGDNILPFIYELDDGDDWRDEANWEKANPGLGYVLTLDGLREEYAKIEVVGRSKEIDFRVKNLNMEQNSQEAWVSYSDWAKCGGQIIDADLAGRECYAGIDLSLTRDITALSLFFPRRNEKERHILRVFFWIPEENPDIDTQNGIPYGDWIGDGWITATDGDVIDHDELAADMLDILKAYKAKRVDIDPFAMIRVALTFQKAGITLNEVAQRVTYLSQPTQELERMILGGELNHGDNPVLNWMVSNCDVYRDSNDNVRIIKSADNKKIDGIAASVNAVYGYLQEMAKPQKASYLFEKGAKLDVI
jgi:phage terminase large subunit-like protein